MLLVYMLMGITLAVVLVSIADISTTPEEEDDDNDRHY